MSKRTRLSTEECKSSIFARHEALKRAITSIKTAPKELITACDSAGALASLDMPAHGITRLGSRNTLFKYSDMLFSEFKSPDGESGWKYIDWLRKEVKTLTEKQKVSRKKETREERIAERRDKAELELAALQRTSMIQTRAYLWLLKEISGLSKSQSIDPMTKQRLENLINSHHELFGDLFSPEFLPSNVINLRKK